MAWVAGLGPAGEIRAGGGHHNRAPLRANAQETEQQGVADGKDHQGKKNGRGSGALGLGCEIT